MPPADAAPPRPRRAVQSAIARQERELDRAADHLQRRPDGAGDGLDQRGLARARFAGEAVDLAAPDLEGDAVDRPDVAVDAEMAGAVVGLQVFTDSIGSRARSRLAVFRPLRRSGSRS